MAATAERQRVGPALRAARFAPHQRRWIADTSPIALWRKSRRIGADWAEAYRCVAAVMRGRGMDVTYASNKEANAREWIEYVKHFARLFGAAIEATTGVEYLGSDELLTFRVEFPRTAQRRAVTVRAMSSNPNAARGLDGDIVLSELAWHPQPEAMYDAAAPVTMLGGMIRILSSPNTEGDFFERLSLLGRKAADPATYGELAEDEVRLSLRETSIHDAAHEAWGSDDPRDAYLEIINDDRGLAYTPEGWIDEVRRKIGRASFPRECELIPDGEANSYYPWATILPAVRADLPAPIELERPEHAQHQAFDREWGAIGTNQVDRLLSVAEVWLANGGGRIVAGVDVGRTDDKFALALGLIRGERVSLVGLMQWRGMTFADMERAIDRLMDWRASGDRVTRLCCDATGIGMQMAEHWARTHGAARCEGVTFTNPAIEGLATQARAYFDRGLIEIPDDRRLHQQINSIRQTRTATGRPRFAGERTEDGHADAYWALALMLEAADARKPEARFVGGGRGAV